MRPVLPALAALLISAASAFAGLSPKTVEYLQTIGIDPHASDIAAVASDTVLMRSGAIASLDELAKHKKPKAEILRFVSTRRFVKAYLQDQNTRLPATDNYNAAYLTDEEKAFVQPAFRRAGDELYLRSLQQRK
jgi:hypothetical protein